MAVSKKRAKKPSKKRCEHDEEHECIGCPSYCCHDLCMYITKPKNRAEVEELNWYLHYERVKVCIRNHRWYILFHDKCMYLGDDHLCAIYEQRSDRCRRHQPPDCERYAPWYQVMLSTPDELEAYLEKLKKKRKRKK